MVLQVTTALGKLQLLVSWNLSIVNSYMYECDVLSVNFVPQTIVDQFCLLMPIGFIEQPRPFIATLGQQVDFNCSITGGEAIFWLVNDEGIHADSNITR